MKNYLLFIATLTFLIGCSAKSPSQTDDPLARAAVDLYIIPLEISTRQLALEMCDQLHKELGFNCRASIDMGTIPTMFNADTKQYMTTVIAAEGQKVAARLQDAASNACFIVLTEKDVNAPNSGLHWEFGDHYPGRLSVISFARMNPRNFGEQPNEVLLKNRLFKMLKRTVGIQYFGYSRSSDLRSVLYSPIMSVKDLDEMGLEFEPK